VTRRAWLGIAAVAVAILGALALRVVLEGRAALADGDEAMQQKRTPDAIDAWERAARWYLPGAPHVGAAYDRLVRLARSDPRHALAAWRAVRSASLATRGLWTPHADDLAEADAAIAALSAEDPEGARPSGADAATRLAFHRERLAGSSGPSRGAVVLAVGGIVCWLAGIAWLVVRAVDRQGRLVRRGAISGAAMALLGVLAWAAGLYNA
jgi:hypothetical protein